MQEAMNSAADDWVFISKPTGSWRLVQHSTTFFLSIELKPPECIAPHKDLGQHPGVHRYTCEI